MLGLIGTVFSNVVAYFFFTILYCSLHALFTSPFFVTNCKHWAFKIIQVHVHLQVRKFCKIFFSSVYPLTVQYGLYFVFKLILISIHAWLLHVRTSIKIDIYSVKFYIIGCRSTIRSQQSMT